MPQNHGVDCPGDVGELETGRVWAAEQNARRQVVYFWACAWILLDTFNCLVFPWPVWIGAHVPPLGHCLAPWSPILLASLCCCCPGYTLASCGGRNRCPSPHIVAFSIFAKTPCSDHLQHLVIPRSFHYCCFPAPTAEVSSNKGVYCGLRSEWLLVPYPSPPSPALPIVCLHLDSSALSQALLLLGP